MRIQTSTSGGREIRNTHFKISEWTVIDIVYLYLNHHGDRGRVAAPDHREFGLETLRELILYNIIYTLAKPTFSE